MSSFALTLISSNVERGFSRNETSPESHDVDRRSTKSFSPLTATVFRAPDRRASSYPHKAELTCASSCTRPILCTPAPRRTSPPRPTDCPNRCETRIRLKPTSMPTCRHVPPSPAHRLPGDSPRPRHLCLRRRLRCLPPTPPAGTTPAPGSPNIATPLRARSAACVCSFHQVTPTDQPTNSPVVRAHGASMPNPLDTGATVRRPLVRRRPTAFFSANAFRRSAGTAAGLRSVQHRRQRLQLRQCVFRDPRGRRYVPHLVCGMPLICTHADVTLCGLWCVSGRHRIYFLG